MLRPPRQSGDLPRLVILESPYAAQEPHGIETHIQYARAAMRDSLIRLEAPLVSHLLYTQVLNDAEPLERNLGMRAGNAWIPYASLVAVYTNLGISSGMYEGIRKAKQCDIPVEFREIRWPQ